MTDFYISSTKYSIQERQTKKHGKVYDVVFRIITPEGIEKQKRLCGYTTKSMAKQAYTEFVTQHCELTKNNPLKKQSAEKEVPTVGDLMRQYLLSLPNQNKDSSIYDKRNIFDRFVFSTLGGIKITKLTKDVLYRWQDDLWTMKNPRTGDFYSYAYLSKIRTHLNTFLTWVENRYKYHNYLHDIPKPRKRAPKKRMKFWTRDQFEQFISVVDDPMYHCFFTMLFYTGRRYGEIIALTPDDIHDNVMTINKSVTRKTLDRSPYKVTTAKAEREQDVEICPVVVDELSRYEPQSPFFFGGDRPLHDKTVTYAFSKYCRAAGVEQIRLHDLRHSFVSMLVHLGANMMVIADLIGDTVEQVMKTYAHLYDSDKHAIIAQITPKNLSQKM